MLLSHWSSVELQNVSAEQFLRDVLLGYQIMWFFGN